MAGKHADIRYCSHVCQNSICLTSNDSSGSKESTRLRMDNLFLLEDGSYALVDYESKYQQADKLKYINYIARTLKKLYAEGIHHPRLRMIVLYTSNVKKVETKLDVGCLHFKIERRLKANSSRYSHCPGF